MKIMRGQSSCSLLKVAGLMAQHSVVSAIVLAVSLTFRQRKMVVAIALLAQQKDVWSQNLKQVLIYSFTRDMACTVTNKNA